VRQYSVDAILLEVLFVIVVTTPAGRIGRQVLNMVLNGEETIRVIVRDPSRLPPHVCERVEVVQGSHEDIEVLTKALAGADCVFWLVPPSRLSENPASHYLSFTRPACEAIKRQGVKRVVGVSSLGRDFGKNAGLLSAAFAMDDLIENTGVSYRSLRMPFFMENLLNQVHTIKSQGTFALVNSGDRKLATRATRDVAAAAARLLLDDSWSGQGSVPVVGPDDLSPNEMAQTMSQVLGRTVCFQQITTADLKAAMVRHGMTEGWAQGIVDMVTAQDQGIYNNEARTARPCKTSFRQWCEEVLKPAVLA